MTASSPFCKVYSDFLTSLAVWVGGGSRIIGPCTIGDGVTVAAGSVCKGVLEPYCVYAGQKRRLEELDGQANASNLGVPARLIKRLERPQE